MTTTGQNTACKIMVFRPSMAEMKDFSKYLEYMESKGAHKAGLAKIIPPPEWKPRRRPYDADDVMNMVIPAPIQQEVLGNGGLYHQYSVEKRRMTVGEFKKLAESDRYKTPPHFDYEDLERKYWKNISFNPAIYGADVSGSIYDQDVDDFNIARLNTILDLIGEDYNVKIEGVNTAYLYFGMWKSSFAWHTEDMDLYSINYLHYGAPKSWYAIPPDHGKRLERLASGFFPKLEKTCNAFLRHKSTIIAPSLLKKYSIPYDKITQEQGEFMITFPYGYHAGYNQGFNIAESTNFALPRWVEYGKRCIQCRCRNDNVIICMDRFVHKFQPERYELWQDGRDYGCHPEDPSRVYAAPLPRSSEQCAGKSKRNPSLHLVSRRHPVSTGNGVATGDDDCEDDRDSLSSSGEMPQQINSKKRSSSVGAVGNGKPTKKARTSKKKSTSSAHAMVTPTVRYETDAEITMAVRQTMEQMMFNLTKKKAKGLPDWVVSHRALFVTKPSPGEKKIPLDKEEVLTIRQNYHRQLCAKSPYCACCVPFSHVAKIEEESLLKQLIKREKEDPPPWTTDGSGGQTEVLVPSTAFGQHGNGLGVTMPVSSLEMPPTSQLVTCERCLLTVHKSCYGVSHDVNSDGVGWVCDACNHEYLLEVYQSRRLTEPLCVLCSMRGGAVKKTVDGRWAHVICAIMIPDVGFENVEERNAIETKNISKARKRLCCSLCKDVPINLQNKGTCIQCNCGRSMHTTCCIASGVVIEVGNWPEPVVSRCPAHRRRNKTSTEPMEQLALEGGKENTLEVGTSVYAKHKNTRFYPAVLQDRFFQTYHIVHFHDGSTTSDLNIQFVHTKDPENSDKWIACNAERLPSISQEVSVLWSDRKTYKGMYAGSRRVEMCTVVFEDESVATLLRKYVFGEADYMPKRIQAKLSFASEMNQADFFEASLPSSTTSGLMSGSGKAKMNGSAKHSGQGNQKACSSPNTATTSGEGATPNNAGISTTNALSESLNKNHSVTPKLTTQKRKRIINSRYENDVTPILNKLL